MSQFLQLGIQHFIKEQNRTEIERERFNSFSIKKKATKIHTFEPKIRISSEME